MSNTIKIKNLLEALEALVKNGTERNGEAVVLMYDHEDGFFISTIDCGTNHYPVKDCEDIKRETLADAIRAAIIWHNKQGEKWYMEYLKKIELSENKL